MAKALGAALETATCSRVDVALYKSLGAGKVLDHRSVVLEQLNSGGQVCDLAAENAASAELKLCEIMARYLKATVAFVWVWGPTWLGNL